MKIKNTKERPRKWMIKNRGRRKSTTKIHYKARYTSSINE